MSLKKTKGLAYSTECGSEPSARARLWKSLAAPFACLSVAVSLLAASGYESASQAESKGKVVISEMNWISQIVNTKVVEILLREEMGYDVEIQLIDYVPGFASLARGDSDVLIEIWDLTGEPYYKEALAEGKIALDPMTMPAYEGWYVPAYVIHGDPARGIEPTCPGLPNWEALNDCAHLFATAETEPKGRYLTGDTSWADLYGDPQRIENLGLNYEMRFAGSEAALVAEIASAYERGEPIITLMWDPHYMVLRYDLVRVEFPPYTPECWGTTYACSWKVMTLYKAMNTESIKRLPEVWEFVQNYDMTREDLGEIMVPIERDGLSAEESVRQWLAANEDVWRAWIPKSN